MRAIVLSLCAALISVTATKALAVEAATPTSPPTAAFELVPPDAERGSPVVEERPVEQPTPWVPLPNSTDYRGGFHRPWTPPPTVERRWYGWQTLLSDAASIGLFVSGVNDDGRGDIRPAIGLFGYALAPPIIHAAHGHALKAFGSLGLRLGAPVVGAVVGFAMAGCEESDDHYDDSDWCGASGAIGGFMVGTAGAMLFDAVVIANEDVVPERPRERVEFRPDVSIGPGRAQVSLAGAF